MHWFAIAVFVSSLISVRSDYKCVCAYSIETTVYSEPSLEGNVLGYLYEFDCKPDAGKSDANWYLVAYEHQVGYIGKNDHLQVQTCAGTIPDEDKIAPVPNTTNMLSTTPGPTATSKRTTDTTLPTSTISIENTTTDRDQMTTARTDNSFRTTTHEPFTTTLTKASTALQPSTTSSSIPSTLKSNTFKPLKLTTMKTFTLTQTQTLIKISSQMPVTNILQGNINLCGAHLINQASREAGTLAQYGHSCYEVVPNTQKTWSEAESFCHSRGGHLAEDISNAKEQHFIQGFLQMYSPKRAVWIGLTDKHSEGHFNWTSGNAVQYTNWVPGHISNYAHHSQEDCVVFIPYMNGQWDDLQCENTLSSFFNGGHVHPLLCQYRVSSGPSFIG